LLPPPIQTREPCMPSIQRPLSGDPLRFRLAEERERLVRSGLQEAQGRTARTLVKDGPLRVSLVVLGAGGGLREHSAPGPITIHALTDGLHVAAEGTVHEMAAGDLLALGPGVPHSVVSESGGAFLLTVVAVAGGAKTGAPRP
jgi:quercetin dioxygenase-like cupin family protein